MISHVFSLKLLLFPLHIWNNPCSSMIFLSKMLDFAKFPEDSIACCRGSDWPSRNLFSATRNPSNFQNSMIACRKVMHSCHKLYIECVQHVFSPGYCRRCFQLSYFLGDAKQIWSRKDALDPGSMSCPRRLGILVSQEMAPKRALHEAKRLLIETYGNLSQMTDSETRDSHGLKWLCL